ncbi:C2 domain-containing protein At1g53590-like isoform X2 [Pistacia vera]|uniref:C2 domain-containing protein At1g53590-like isoform X2 n=1 Tax=Pistacia vera TaxID=55513 RepID=UPI001262DAF9|nr:C2 domain-containing protein At1g53590-like isoform X2 [Pistacia vera]XP_031259828.1 C2 domain-containing protein At1g53590-like isoform X2 [Pistacia vera]
MYTLMEVSIMHHVGIVFLFLWLLSSFNRCGPIVFFISLIYLYLVHEQYVERLRRKLQFEERKQSYQRRVLSDSETVRWLNHAVANIWPICLEQIASQKILLPIIPWFLDKYKPWTAKEAVVQHLYLGRNPPMFTEMRVLRHSNDDDHLVLELGMNFLTADDMSAIIAVKLRKRLGFGMWAKLHVTGMHVEGKVLIGVKFLRQWPFLGRLRLCFSEPPYFQMTVKPIFTHGLDVTELPGIAGWLDKLLSVAFEQTLVEPNMLVVDMEKFTSPQPDNWFSVDVKEPVAHAIIEVVEASDMKPSDLNGLADPYVKGQLGQYRFRTKTQKKTLTPKWQEEFKVPICSWDSPNVLSIEVRDKDHFVDDTLGDCTINISDLRDGQRHDMWIPLKNIKMGRLHLAITVTEESAKGENPGQHPWDEETLNKEGVQDEEELRSKEDIQNSFANETRGGSFSSVTSDKSPKMADNFEPINIEGQEECGIWVHHPGSEVAQTWEPRKGKSRRIDTQIERVHNDSSHSNNSAAFGSLNNDSSSTDEISEGKNPINSVRRGLRKIGSMFQRSPKRGDYSGSISEPVTSPHANLKAANSRDVGVKFIVEDLPGPISGSVLKEVCINSDGSNPESPEKTSNQESPERKHMKVTAKSILKQAEKRARNIKHVLSRKGSRKSPGDSTTGTEREIYPESDSSHDDSFQSPSIVEKIPEWGNDDESCNTKERIVQTGSSDPEMDAEDQREKMSVEADEKKWDNEISKLDGSGNELIVSVTPKLSEEDMKHTENKKSRSAENIIS